MSDLNMRDYVVICGSLDQEDRILEVAKEFIFRGYNVYFASKSDYDLHYKHKLFIKKIQKCDIFCYVEKPDGTIEEPTDYELAMAKVFGRAIIAIPAEGEDFRDQIRSFVSYE